MSKLNITAHHFAPKTSSNLTPSNSLPSTPPRSSMPVPTPASITPLPATPFLEELTALASAASNVDAKSIADGIALKLKKAPRTIEAIQEGKIVDVVLAWSASSSGYEKESAPVLVERICRSLSTGVEGVFLPLIPALLNLSMDKGQPVRSAVNSAMTSLIKATSVEGSRMVFEVLCRVLEDSKGWRTKVAALKAMEGLVKPGAEEYVANELGKVIPMVEHAMHDTKTEVSNTPLPKRVMLIPGLRSSEQGR